MNPADLVTKPRSVKELAADEFWQRGPDFLRTSFESWPIKTTLRMERLDGDLLPKELVSHVMLSVSREGCLWKLLEETSNLERLHRILARVLRWKSVARLRELKQQPPTAAEMTAAKTKWVLWVQQEMAGDLEEPTTAAIHESTR